MAVNRVTLGVNRVTLRVNRVTLRVNISRSKDSEKVNPTTFLLLLKGFKNVNEDLQIMF